MHTTHMHIYHPSDSDIHKWLSIMGIQFHQLYIEASLIQTSLFIPPLTNMPSESQDSPLIIANCLNPLWHPIIPHMPYYKVADIYPILPTCLTIVTTAHWIWLPPWLLLNICIVHHMLNMRHTFLMKWIPHVLSWMWNQFRRSVVYLWV